MVTSQRHLVTFQQVVSVIGRCRGPRSPGLGPVLPGLIRVAT